MKRKIKPDEGPVLVEMLQNLIEILLDIGIVEFSTSKKKREFFFDTENGAKIDPVALREFAEVVEKYYFDRLEKTSREVTL
jgi:hypothetical protein